MELVIYTRCYVQSDKLRLSEVTVNSMYKLFSLQNTLKVHNITWDLFVSNIGPGNDKVKLLKVLDFSDSDTIRKFNEMINSGFLIPHCIKDRRSASQTREHILKYFAIPRYKPGSDMTLSVANFFMNLDSDDALLNPKGILRLTVSDANPSLDLYNTDLIAFGLEVPEGSKFYDKWRFTEDYLKKSRRYCTTETQTMFLFIHSFRVLKYLSSTAWAKGMMVEDPNESCEDTRLAIAVAEYNFLNSNYPFRISAIQENFIKYNEHEGQVSSNQTTEYKDKLAKFLLDFGYLYVNKNFYRFDKNNVLIKFNPYEHE